MIDEDIIESMAGDIRPEVKRAVKLLVESGVIQAQRQRLLEQLAVGDSNQPLPLAAQEVLEFRQKNQALMSLEELGQRYITEEDGNA